MTARLPGGDAVIAAWPQPAALLDAAGRVILANAALRGVLGSAVLIRGGMSQPGFSRPRRQRSPPPSPARRRLW